ncbi:hypothetical protein Lal_00005818 [Lupinus albus]|nr:hypothetical protein Lal_00005818 [Lupinus albus]
MLNNLPSDENLNKRGFSIETCEHLFLHCKKFNSIWRWLGSLIDFQIDTSSICSLLHSTMAPWSPQLKEVIVAYILSTFYTVWHYRNKIRFDDLTISLNQVISRIKVDTALCGKFSNLKAMTSLFEFSILWALNVVFWLLRQYLGIQDSLYTKLFTAFFAIKIAYAKGWHVIWLECDSTWAMDFFNGKNKISWKLSNL